MAASASASPVLIRSSDPRGKSCGSYVITARLAAITLSGNGLHVNERRRREIPILEGCGNVANVGPNCRNADAVVLVVLQLDATAIRQRIELVGLGVLIHAHRLLAAFLDTGERRILAPSGRRTQ